MPKVNPQTARWRTAGLTGRGQQSSEVANLALCGLTATGTVTDLFFRKRRTRTARDVEHVISHILLGLLGPACPALALSAYSDSGLSQTHTPSVCVAARTSRARGYMIQIQSLSMFGDAGCCATGRCALPRAGGVPKAATSPLRVRCSKTPCGDDATREGPLDETLTAASAWPPWPPGR